MQQPTAAILAIGDELLSGRTRDSNINFLASWLTQRGVKLTEARIVADDKTAIIEALNVLRSSYDYVFTSGGIGPTHDDITAQSIASAFGVEVIEHPEAIALIEQWYHAKGEEVTPARRRMARTPKGARLILNKVSGAPGIVIENVFVMAGVPRIFQAMLETIADEIKGGAQILSKAVTGKSLPESVIADDIARIESEIAEVQLGSYPIDGDEKGVTIIARSLDETAVKKAIDAVGNVMRAHGIEPVFEDRK